MYEQIRQLLARKFQINPAEITPQTTLEDLELDSLDRVELSMALDKELGVRITDDELAAAGNLTNLLRLAESRSLAA